MSRTLVSFGARLLAVATVLAVAPPGRADSLPLCVLGQDGATVLATGNVVVNPLDSTHASVAVTLTNTGPGTITGLGFCDPTAGAMAQVTAVTALASQCGPGSPAQFGLLTGLNLNAVLGGVAGLGTFLGVGTSVPAQGLAAGQSGTFVLNVLGTDVQALTAASLLAGDGINAQLRLSVCLDPSLPIFCPVNCSPCPPHDPSCGSGTHPVPAPPGAVLAGLGLGCALLGRFRRTVGARA